MNVNEACGDYFNHLATQDFGQLTAEIVEQQAVERNSQKRSKKDIDALASTDYDKWARIKREVACDKLSWLWAANAYAIEENKTKFAECLQKAHDVYLQHLADDGFDPRNPTKGPNGERESKIKALEILASHPDEAYELVRSMIEVTDRSYKNIWGDDVMYDDEQQQKLAEAAYSTLFMVRSNMGLKMPTGKKERALRQRKEKLDERIKRHQKTVEGYSWAGKLWRARKIADEEFKLRDETEKLMRERESYNLMDDIEVHESSNGIAVIGFGDFTMTLCDLRFPGNVPIYYTRAWHAKQMSGREGMPVFLGAQTESCIYADEDDTIIGRGSNVEGWILTRKE